MRIFKDINEAWQEGFTEGWRSILPTLPSIPDRPGPAPDGEGDQLKRYYDEGYYQGQLAATKRGSGLS